MASADTMKLSIPCSNSDTTASNESLFSWSGALGKLSSAARRWSKKESSDDRLSESDTDVSTNDSPSIETLTPQSSLDSDNECVYSRSRLLDLKPKTSQSLSSDRLKTQPVPLSYENSPKSTKSKIVLPVRHHKAQTISPTAGSWVAQRRSDAGQNPDVDAKVERAARSIMNKITAETFDSLFDRLVNCGIQKPEHISKLMSVVFEVATKQHHFIPMYADVCVRLEMNSCIKAVVEVAGHQHNFRRLLLNQCQAVFEQLLEPCAVEDASDEEAALRRKQEALGNIKLIGHLLMRGMLSSKLLVECAQELLAKRTTCREALESLAALMTVAAPTFDTTEWAHHAKLEECFTTMRKLTKDKTVVPRNRFLLRDVLDVREAGWPNSTKNTAVIKTESPREAGPGCKDLGQASGTQGQSFDLKIFRRNLASILSDLTSDRNVANAVRRVRIAGVPAEYQAAQFADIITRIVEEKRGPPRRCALAFAAGLAAAEPPAFDREQCLEGMISFFQDVYPDLCNEVPRLPAIVRSELTPTFCSVFPKAEIESCLPPGVRF